LDETNLVVDVVVVRKVASNVNSRSTSAVLVHFVILPVVWVGCKAREESVSGIPVGRERSTVGVNQAAVDSGSVAVVALLGVGVGVLGKTRLFVDTHSAALGTIGRLSVQVLGVYGTCYIEAVAVVGSDDNEGLIELADGVKMSNGSLDGVVKLEKVTKSTVVVESVHLLVDGCSLRHHEETFATRVSTVVENVNSLEGHLLETRLVSGVSTTAVGRVAVASEVVGVNAIKLVSVCTVLETSDPSLTFCPTKHPCC